VSIIIKFVSSNPVHGEVYSIHYYVIKFVSDLRQFCGILRLSSTTKTDRHDMSGMVSLLSTKTIARGETYNSCRGDNKLDVLRLTKL
jgi:hypothetical protein